MTPQYIKIINLMTLVIGDLYHSLDTSGNNDAEAARNRMEHFSNLKNKLKEEVDEYAENIRKYEGKKDSIEKILRSNENTTMLQNSIDTTRRTISFEIKQLEKNRKEFIKLFNSENSTDFISRSLYKEVLSFLSSTKAAEKGIKDLNKSVILELLKRNKCLCGCNLKEGEEAYEHVKEHLQYIPPESIGTTINGYKKDINSKLKSSENHFDDLEAKYKNILEIKNRLSELEDELTGYENELAGKESMDQYKDELSNCKNRLISLRTKKEDLLRQEFDAERSYEQAKKVFDSLKSNTDKNKEISNYLAYAYKIKEWLDKVYQSKEVVVRQSLEEKVNKIFNEMYHGKRRVVIDDKYRVSLLSTIGDNEIDTGESEGSNRVKSFAFISGIVSLARDKIVSTSNIDIESEPYPLVMDAPFSNADEEHTKNISRILPEVAEQVIMFVMEKDWKYAKQVMDDKVGARYLLDKKSETYTVIEEV